MNGYGKLRRFTDKREVIVEFYLNCSACRAWLLLIAGLVWLGRITAPLQRVYERLGAGRVLPRSIPAAAGLLLLSVVVTVLVFTW